MEEYFGINCKEKIDNYLKDIVNYYLTLKGTANFLDFLKIELKCINEALDLIDLNMLPLSKEYTEEYRQIVYEALEDNNYLKITGKLSIEVVENIFKIKKIYANVQTGTSDF